MIRIAFTPNNSQNWTGGYNYLLNLVKVVTEQRAADINPVLFFGTDMNPKHTTPFRSITGVEIVTSPHLNCSRRKVSLLRSLMLGADPGIRRLFHENCIDVVFENAQFHGVGIGIPTIAWFPDFQHRELPHLFSHTAWWKRELGFRVQIAAGRSIMLSSNDARDACERFYPATVGRTQVVRFAVSSPYRPNASEIARVREIYSLPTRYFYLPNQFWQHKNHLLVIETLTLLKEHHPDIVVVASGKQLDPYKPDYFSKFLSRLEEAGVKDQFYLLGLIPYEHIGPLMVGSVAMINPSLFEGWSTTVEEARAHQVPMILSDLPVHKEQAGDIARFFDRKSAKSLADELLWAWQKQPTIKESLTYTGNSNSDSIKRFADNFAGFVQRVVAQQPTARRASR